MNVRTGSPNYTRARQSLPHNFVLNPNAESGSGDITTNGLVVVAAQSGVPLESNYAFKIDFLPGVSAGDYAAWSVERLPVYLRNQACQVAFDCYNSGAAGFATVQLYDGNNAVTPAITSIGSGYVRYNSVFGSTASISDYQLRIKSAGTPGSLIVNQFYVGRLVEGFSGTVTVNNTGTVNNTTNNYYSVSGGVAQSQLDELSGVLFQSGQLLQAADTAIRNLISTVSGNLIESGQVLRASDSLLNTALSNLSGNLIQSGQILRASDNLLNTAIITMSGNLIQSGQILRASTGNSVIEYVSNSGTVDGDDTTSFSSDINGSAIPALTSAYKRRIQFSSAITANDLIQVEVDWDGNGFWQRWDRYYDNSNGAYGPTVEYFSSTQLDVWFRGAHYARFRDSDINNRSYTQENAAGSRWRVTKTSR